MSVKQPQSSHLPTPERPSPCHPAPWRQIEATLYERINDIVRRVFASNQLPLTVQTLPDVVETAGSHLIPAPPTPIPTYSSSSSDDDVFIKRLHRALELALFGQKVRCSLYGREIAENTRPGHSPDGLREKLLRETWEGIDSSSDSGSATPIETTTPPSCDEDTSRLEAHVKDDMAENEIPASGWKRRRETEEGQGGRVKRRRTTGNQ
ncbi:hypothetical protein F66182_1014 [Fusarium sp. NRRL 66182]|nr:hypothetical protein F66182_1014 [Fusarium sp. NRRL 66182]